MIHEVYVEVWNDHRTWPCMNQKKLCRCENWSITTSVNGWLSSYVNIKLICIHLQNNFEECWKG